MLITSLALFGIVLTLAGAFTANRAKSPPAASVGSVVTMIGVAVLLLVAVLIVAGAEEIWTRGGLDEFSGPHH